MLRLLVTCEHGGNNVPAAYTPLFEDHRDLLNSHEGYDIGAKELFQQLEGMAHKSFCAETTRLLVELNRSLHHKKLFSSVTRPLPAKEKEQILQAYYHPYRSRVEGLVHDFVMAGRQVLHIAVHTFTPIFKGEVRQGDIGLLYDSKRGEEQRFCRAWKERLQAVDPSLLVRFNYPYLGISDGFPTYLRRKFTDAEYMGIELEVNQKFALGDPKQWQQVQQIIRLSLQQMLEPYWENEQQEYA
ncbi:N-formylglutamate amidohydrolase [Pontibacter sp. E15-1]|uniref:N-formylglutamate amidohydrolase n=1 Tax=Pontibacter sp. E15-1 TaxID=2919918 RepID=UPI001F504083|nr:N-formylglutamate amidohydrolase [Pontibacter sp. E15-1]MCJ8163629.1 N-formylglutamate amidohydrolase [Pontibacter sp. E15-1]